MPPRRRIQTTRLPNRIKADQLPPYVYWRPAGRGRWVIYIDGSPRRLTDATASLAEIWRAHEAFKAPDRKTFRWLSGEFQSSPAWSDLAESTRRDYRYCHDAICSRKLKDGRLFGDILLAEWSSGAITRYLDARACAPPSTPRLPCMAACPPSISCLANPAADCWRPPSKPPSNGSCAPTRAIDGPCTTSSARAYPTPPATNSPPAAIAHRPCSRSMTCSRLRPILLNRCKKPARTLRSCQEDRHRRTSDACLPGRPLGRFSIGSAIPRAIHDRGAISAR